MTADKTGGWYFGWNIVAVAACMTLLSSGMRLSFGPFFLPISHDLGFSRSLLASIVAVGMLEDRGHAYVHLESPRKPLVSTLCSVL